MNSHHTLESLFSPLTAPIPPTSTQPQAGPSMFRSVSQDHSYTYEEDDALDTEVEENVFRDMTFDEVLEDLNARFLVNLPKEETTLVRIYWQAEQAHWFYEDYLRPLNPHLPSLGQRHFTQLIISSSPIYASLAGPDGIDYDGVWGEYISYKSMVPCCGGILLNVEGDKCLMVRGWKSSAGWCFPRGKINLNEPEPDCAIREVFEETGFDITGRINPSDQIQTQVNAQIVTMFIVPGVDEATLFETQTRKEIGAIEWVNLTDLPTWTGRKPKKTASKGKKFYNVTPFVGPLKKWLKQHSYNPNPPSSKKKQSHSQPQAPPQSYQRDLQPFYDPSTPARPSQPHTRGASALNTLFDRFITKQEDDLSAAAAASGRDGGGGGTRGDPGRVTGAAEQKDGLQRLFGNLNVLQAEKQAMRPEDGTLQVQGSEEDELARLLGGVTVTSKPPPAEKLSSLPQHSASKASQLQPHSEKANRLLSLLTANAGGSAQSPAQVAATAAPPESGAGIASIASTLTPTIPMPMPAPAPVPAFPPPSAVNEHISPVAGPASPTSQMRKPHQASLLSLLSPTQPPALAPAPAGPGSSASIGLAAPHTESANSSISANDRLGVMDDQEASRKEKQRRLLEMTLAGLEQPTTSAIVSQSKSTQHSSSLYEPSTPTDAQPALAYASVAGYGHRQPDHTDMAQPLRPAGSSPTKPVSTQSNPSPLDGRHLPYPPASTGSNATPYSAPPARPAPAVAVNVLPPPTVVHPYPSPPTAQPMHQRQQQLLDALASRPGPVPVPQPYAPSNAIPPPGRGPMPDPYSNPRQLPGGYSRPTVQLPFTPGQPLGPARPPGYIGGAPGQPGQSYPHPHPPPPPHLPGFPAQTANIIPPGSMPMQSMQGYRPSPTTSSTAYRPAPFAPNQHVPMPNLGNPTDYAPAIAGLNASIGQPPVRFQQQQQQRHNHNVQVLQPVPRPAALGLLAMINAKSDQ